MAHLSLPGSRLLCGIDFSDERQLAPPAVVLFPAPGARDIGELVGRRDLHVIVIDGTWSQARKLWKHNPRLQALPAYALKPKSPGQYRIRKEPAPECLATIEALAELLEVVEGRDRELLLRPFLAMVEQQLRHAASPSRRHVHVPRQRRQLRLPAVQGQTILACSAREPCQPQQFYALCKGEHWSGSEEALAVLVRGSAVVCWGQYVPRQLAEHGIVAIDLKPLLRDHHKQRLGHAETACLRLGLEPTKEASRARRRLACLSQLWELAKREARV